MAVRDSAYKDPDGHDGLNGQTSSKPASLTDQERIPTSAADAAAAASASSAPLTGPYPNGYHFPPALSWKEGFLRGCKAFWNYTWTPLGFFVVLYGLNVVAWGGMLFLIMLNAAPAMCHPSCNDINSPRRIWVEITSQILNALFCVTGFGLAPWRFRDLYFLLKWRVGSQTQALRRLAGFHRGWVRLPGSETLPVDLGPDNIADYAAGKGLECVPVPEKKMPDAPLTGVRAPPTRPWKIDFVIWFNVSNTFLQVGLATLMWAMNRYNRPAWATGLLVALACIAAMIGGFMMFWEGKQVKKIEGVPVCEEDLERLRRDKEQGIIHYNNINDKKPKEKKSKRKSRQEKVDSMA